MPPSDIRSNIRIDGEGAAPIITSLSFAHPRVSAEDRAPLAVPEERWAEALGRVRGVLPEIAVLSTCLRHEVISVGADFDKLAAVTRELSGVESLPDNAEVRYGREAVEHLFQVAAGFRSPILGEPEVLGQVRRAHRAAIEAGTAGPALDQLFREAIRAGREVRALLPEPDHGSLAAVAVDRLRARPRGTVVLVGAGRVATGVVDRLGSDGWHVVRLTRRPERIQGAASLDRLEEELAGADAAITAVTSVHPLLDAAGLARVAAARRADRRDGDLLLLDVGMPTNVAWEPTPGVLYEGVDDLAAGDPSRKVTDEALALLQLRAVEAHTRITNASLAPLIRALHGKAEEATEEEIERALARLGDVDDDVRSVVEQLARTLANRLMHDPLLYLSSHPKAIVTRETARSILGL